MSDEGGFDPRYSPEFQRGYEPGSRGRTDEVPKSHSPSRVAPMPVAPVPDRVVHPADEPDQLDSVSAIDAGDAEGVPDGGSLAEPRPWRNPYLVSLAVIGPAMTIAGVTLFRWAVTQMYSGQISGGTSTTEEARADWIWVQVAWGIAPLLCIAGVLTVIGVVFFLATRWTPGSRTTVNANGELDA
ncbi:hypothetical protein [Mycetocola zhujimingii]|uniref:Uncharacterized protein n=1 Tax=Mycetocola zhujimingii TaxID=2079792 RepID=A0A2U1TAL2_9MICO|nr:hypothetical protein [Mycetocola zhujimingii]PWC04736.1 hypothetical protein DF223_14990 [Mycetocola zhujimingii]